MMKIWESFTHKDDAIEDKHHDFEKTLTAHFGRFPLLLKIKRK